MLRLATVMGSAILLAAFLVGTGHSGDAKGGTGKKIGLPKYWSRLGLSADQKSKVIKLRTEYGAKIQALREQIDKLTKEERSELFTVLTTEQKKRLRQIYNEKAGGDLDTPPEKKTTKKKGSTDR